MRLTCWNIEPLLQTYASVCGGGGRRGWCCSDFFKYIKNRLVRFFSQNFVFFPQKMEDFFLGYEDIFGGGGGIALEAFMVNVQNGK